MLTQRFSLTVLMSLMILGLACSTPVSAQEKGLDTLQMEKVDDAPKLEKITTAQFMFLDQVGETIKAGNAQKMASMLWDAETSQTWEDALKPKAWEQFMIAGQRQLKTLPDEIEALAPFYTLQKHTSEDSTRRHFYVFVPTKLKYPTFILGHNAMDEPEHFKPIAEIKLRPESYLCIEMVEFSEAVGGGYCVVIR